MPPALYGFAASLSLILAIGSQNAFVLKQGLKGHHVFWVCLVCAASDALLIAGGVSGFHAVVNQWAWITTASRYAGAVFLLWYGAHSFLAALRSSATLVPDAGNEPPLWTTLSTCVALTFLNPHVYLDTVVLLGSLSTQFQGRAHEFAAGAVAASFLFFFSLGFGARLLRPLFQNPVTWKVLEWIIGVTMWGIAAKLLWSD